MTKNHGFVVGKKKKTREEIHYLNRPCILQFTYGKKGEKKSLPWVSHLSKSPGWWGGAVLPLLLEFKETDGNHGL